MVIVRKYMRYPGGLKKAVTFSYDDNNKYNIRLAKTLHKHGIKCTFNINSGRINKTTCDNENYLTYDDIKENILNLSHEVAVHGKDHIAPGAVSVLEGINEFLDCRKDLEKNLGLIIRGMAYPNDGIRHINPGNSYENIRNYLAELGIVYSRTLGFDNNDFELPTDWFNWKPTAHHKNPNLMNYIDEFVNLDVDAKYHTTRYSKLFYLWGHAFEFEYDNNWELLDEICENLAGKEDIWYATNIEIYDYIKAYNSLIWSADHKTVYNPTVTKIWIEINDVMYTVSPGETLKLD